MHHILFGSGDIVQLHGFQKSLTFRPAALRLQVIEIEQIPVSFLIEIIDDGADPFHIVHHNGIEIRLLHLSIGDHHRNPLNPGRHLRVMDQLIKDRSDQHNSIHLFFGKDLEIPAAFADRTARITDGHIIPLIAENLFNHVNHSGVVGHPDIHSQNRNTLHRLRHHPTRNGAGFVVVLLKHLLHPLSDFRIYIPFIIQYP